MTTTSTQRHYEQPGADVSVSGIVVWMRGHPIAAYFTLAFAITWALHMPMVLGRNGLGIFNYEVPMALFIILFILGAIAGPTLGAFLVTNALEGKEGRRKLFRRYAQWRVGLPWYALAILGFPTIYLIAGSVVMGSVPLADLGANWTTFFSPYLVAVLIFPAFITWGEEPGWRGFALTRLQENYHPLLSTVIVGFMHGLWHLPVFTLVSGPIPLGPFSLTGFTINIATTIATAILFTWVFNHARGSILIAVLIHASLNATQAWMSVLIPDFPMDAAGKIVQGLYFAAAVAVIIMTRGRLGYTAGMKMSPDAFASVVEVRKDKRPSWLTKNSLLVYGLLAYAISWGIGFSAVAAMQNRLLDPDGTFAAVLGQIAAASPALAALVVIGATRGRQGLADWLRSLVKWRVGLRWYFFALFGIPVAALSIYSILYGAPLFQTLSRQWTILFTRFLPAVAFTFLATGLAEEPGWRGFALPGIQAKHGPLMGSLILGVFWALWHLPNSVLWDTPMIFFLLQIAATMISTFVHTWVYNSTQGSVFIAMLLHASGNMTSGLVSFLVGATDVMFKYQINIAGLIGTAALMIVVLLLTRGRLGYQPAEETAYGSGALDEKASA